MNPLMTFEKVTHDLDCAICLETCSIPIVMCRNGHNFCSNCTVRVATCPVCRERGKPSHRNTFAEKYLMNVYEELQRRSTNQEVTGESLPLLSNAVSDVKGCRNDWDNSYDRNYANAQEYCQQPQAAKILRGGGNRGSQHSNQGSGRCGGGEGGARGSSPGKAKRGGRKSGVQGYTQQCWKIGAQGGSVWSSNLCSLGFNQNSYNTGAQGYETSCGNLNAQSCNHGKGNMGAPCYIQHKSSFTIQQGNYQRAMYDWETSLPDYNVLAPGWNVVGYDQMQHNPPCTH